MIQILMVVVVAGWLAYLLYLIVQALRSPRRKE